MQTPLGANRGFAHRPDLVIVLACAIAACDRGPLPSDKGEPNMRMWDVVVPDLPEEKTDSTLMDGRRVPSSACYVLTSTRACPFSPTCPRT